MRHALEVLAGTAGALLLAEVVLGASGHVFPGAWALFAVAGAVVLGRGATALGALLRRPAPPDPDHE